MSKRSVVLLLCVCALIVRLSLLFFVDPTIRFGDDVYYDVIAENIVQGNGPIVNAGKVAHRMPGYPYFLSLIKERCPTEDCYVHCVRLTQAVVSTASVVPVYLFLLMLVSPLYALAGGLLYVFNPLVSVFPAFLLPETLFSAVLLWLVYAVCRYAQTPRMRWLCAIVFFVGVGIYIKEVFLPFALFSTVVAFLLPQAKSFRAGVLIMTITACCVLVPWIVRNYIELKAFVPMTTNTGYTLYDSFNPRADGGTDVSVYDIPENRVGGGELVQDRHWKQLTRNAIAHDPLRAVMLVPRKFMHLWSPVPNTASFRSPMILVLFAGYYVPVFAFFLVGIWQLFRKKEPVVCMIAIPVLFITVLHMIIIGSLKYRMPIEPFIIVLSVYGYSRMREKRG